MAPPQEPAALTIESFELQPAGEPSLYALNALLRNRSGHVVQWPALELTLLDGAGDRIAFVAEADLIIGLTACSAPQSNNGSFKPIHYRID